MAQQHCLVTRSKKKREAENPNKQIRQKLTLPLTQILMFNTAVDLSSGPLSKYPGPKLWAISKIPYNWHTLRGTAALKLCELHAKYGDVVRYAPRALSYTAPEAWAEVQGPYAYGKKHMEMDPAIFGGKFTMTGALQM